MLSADDFAVSGAAGEVGQMAGQFAKLEGCRVVGVAVDQKVVLRMSCLTPLDYKAEADSLRLLPRPEGVDLFFDNVGGEILEAALLHLRFKGRIVMCGRISQSAAEERYGVTNLGL